MLYVISMFTCKISYVVSATWMSMNDASQSNLWYKAEIQL